MKLTRRTALASVAALAMSAGAFAQGYPTKTITMVVPFTAGGPTDTVARSLAQAMMKTLGQTVVVENRDGAGGTIGAGFVQRAQPDGYTFLLHHNGMSSAPWLYRKLTYKPLEDFEYLGQVVDVPMTLIARKDFAPKTTAELLAYVKANPDKVNLANAGPGAVSHLCGMLFQQAVAAPMQTIPYKGTGPAMNALLGGQVDLMCDQTTQTVPHITAGSVKLYGVTTKQRIAALPDAPTLSEGGLKDFEMVVWHGLYAPKGTPKEALDKVNGALRAALKDPTFIEAMKKLGGNIVPEAKQTPEALKTWLKSETDRWGPLIKAAGVYAD